MLYEIESLLTEALVGMFIGTALVGGVMLITLLSMVSGEFVWLVGATTIKFGRFIWRFVLMIG